MTDHVASVKAK